MENRLGNYVQQTQLRGRGTTNWFGHQPFAYRAIDNYQASSYRWQNLANNCRSRSVGPSSSPTNINERMTSVCPPIRRFNSLQKQHRSLDGMQMDEYETGGSSTMHPLDITTVPAGVAPGQYVPGSLSNPTTTNAYFWRHAPGISSYEVDSYAADSHAARAYEMLKQDYEITLQKLNSTMNSIKTFWSPELKRERQLRKEETARLLELQKRLSTRPASDYQLAELKNLIHNCHRELAEKNEMIKRLMERTSIGAFRDSGSHVTDLETRCSQLEALVDLRQEQIRSMEQHLSQLPSKSQAFKDQRIEELEDELAVMRCERTDLPRDFTDKTVSAHEINTLRMKMERSEVELAQKSAELSSVQARLQAATETAEDLRKRVEVLRESCAAKERHSALLQSDIEALRAKLETKNTQLEGKTKMCEHLETELSIEKNRNSEICDANRTLEQRLCQIHTRLNNSEELLYNKETELDKTKQKLLAHPDVRKEEELQLQIDEANREKARLQALIDELRRNAEKEKVQQLETFQAQNLQLTTAIESLQKELADREVLLESQSEKIGDLDRELINIEQQSKERTQSTSKDEDLIEARKEIESLLRMVHMLEKEKTSLISQCKQLQSKFEEGRRDETVGSLQIRREFPTHKSESSLRSRVEELEEALRESVSITAERELHVAQQKQLTQHLNAQLIDCRRELNELRNRVKNLTCTDRDEILRSLEVERRKQIEQLMQLKHEALLAAIAEKDSHIAILEKSGERPRNEIDVLRRHKEKLMEKLKEENERRVQLINASDIIITGDLIKETMPTGASLIPASPMSAPASLGTPLQIADQEDDADGIWA